MQVTKTPTGKLTRLAGISPFLLGNTSSILHFPSYVRLPECRIYVLRHVFVLWSHLMYLKDYYVYYPCGDYLINQNIPSLNNQSDPWLSLVLLEPINSHQNSSLKALRSPKPQQSWSQTTGTQCLTCATQQIHHFFPQSNMSHHDPMMFQKPSSNKKRFTHEKTQFTNFTKTSKLHFLCVFLHPPQKKTNPKCWAFFQQKSHSNPT